MTATDLEMAYHMGYDDALAKRKPDASKAQVLAPYDLATENAKLRELATGLYKCWINEGCEGCPMQDDDGWCVRDIRLRELGVEVDE